MDLTPPTTDSEPVFDKVYQDSVRQSIGCLVLVLNTCIKSELYGANQVEYAIPKQGHRDFITQKLLQMVEKLG